MHRGFEKVWICLFPEQLMNCDKSLVTLLFSYMTEITTQMAQPKSSIVVAVGRTNCKLAYAKTIKYRICFDSYHGKVRLKIMIPVVSTNATFCSKAQFLCVKIWLNCFIVLCHVNCQDDVCDSVYRVIQKLYCPGWLNKQTNNQSNKQTNKQNNNFTQKRHTSQTFRYFSNIFLNIKVFNCWSKGQIEDNDPDFVNFYQCCIHAWNNLEKILLFGRNFWLWN